MARKGQTPAQPVKQEPVDVAPNMDSLDSGAPVVEKAAQPPAVETLLTPQPDLEPITATPEPVMQPEQEQASESAVPAAFELVLPPDEPSPAPVPAPVPPVDVEPLAVYAARIEEVGQPLAVCEITHPDAKDGGLHVGKYAGIRLVRGNTPAALLSDGSTI